MILEVTVIKGGQQLHGHDESQRMQSVEILADGIE
jgi:hypothetical protein